MVKELTRVGIVGLELTREEIIDIKESLRAVMRKAQCREVNEEIIDSISSVINELGKIDRKITTELDEILHEINRLNTLNTIV